MKFMGDYYQNTLDEIKLLKDKQEWQLAFNRVNEELSMPYIPMEYMVKFEELQRELHALINPLDENVVILSFEQIEQALLSDELSAIEALNSLKKLHLVPYCQRIQRLLDVKLNPVIEALLILALIEQRLDYNFKLSKSFDIEFNPLYLEHPEDSDGYLVAKEVLEKLLVKDPSSLKMAFDLLVEEVLLMLPLSYDESEGEYLAYSIIKTVDTLSGRSDDWKSRVSEYQIDEKKLIPLQSSTVSTL